MIQTIKKEYTDLLKKRAFIMRELSSLPVGYISRKNINGKEYCYLQSRKNGKVTSSYIKAEDAETVSAHLNLRKQYESELANIDQRLSEIENAVKLLDKSDSHFLDLLKLSVGMDDISNRSKQKSVSFADAMTSIEGVPVSDKTRKDVNEWVNGAVSFLSVFEGTLKRYGFPVEV